MHISAHQSRFTVHTPTTTLASPRHVFATAPISASDKIDCDQPGPDGADRRCLSPAEIKDCAALYSVRILVAGNVCTVWEVRGRRSVGYAVRCGFFCFEGILLGVNFKPGRLML